MDFDYFAPPRISNHMLVLYEEFLKDFQTCIVVDERQISNSQCIHVCIILGILFQILHFSTSTHHNSQGHIFISSLLLGHHYVKAHLLPVFACTTRVRSVLTWNDNMLMQKYKEIQCSILALI